MLEDDFSLPIPISQEDQQFLNQIFDRDYCFPSVYHFVKAAKILEFWPDERTLFRFQFIFLKQKFGVWKDEDEILELPFGIFSFLYQIAPFSFRNNYGKLCCPKKRPHIPNFANFRPDLPELIIENQKMAFLLCFCKNFKFKRLLVRLYRCSYPAELNFYIGKIVKRNPSINLRIGFFPISTLYKHSDAMDSIRDNFESFREKESNPHVNFENLFTQFSNSILPCFFEWKKAKSLSLTTYSTCPDEISLLLQFFNCIPNLELNFERFPEISSFFASREFFLQNLESLSLKFSSYWNPPIKELKGNINFSETLKSLKIEGSLFKVPVDWLLSTCTQLENLSIGIFGTSKQEALDLLKTLSTLKCLKTLEISLDCSLEFNNFFLNYISLFIFNLKSLNILFKSYSGEIEKVSNCHFTNLEEFSYQIYNSNRPDNFFHLFVENLKSLKCYHDHSFNRFPDFFSKLPQLESLVMGRCYYDSSKQSFLLSPDQHLKTLEFPYLRSLDSLSNLRSLTINTAMPNLFQQIQKLSALEELTIFNSHRRNKDRFNFNSIAKLSKLKLLHLGSNNLEYHWKAVGKPHKGESLQAVTWEGHPENLVYILEGYFSVGVEVYRIF